MTDFASKPELCSIIEGVEGHLVIDGVQVRVIVTASLLQHHLGATLETSTWLPTFQANEAVILESARRAYLSTRKPLVVLQRL